MKESEVNRSSTQITNSYVTLLKVLYLVREDEEALSNILYRSVSIVILRKKL